MDLNVNLDLNNLNVDSDVSHLNISEFFSITSSQLSSEDWWSLFGNSIPGLSQSESTTDEEMSNTSESNSTPVQHMAHMDGLYGQSSSETPVPERKRGRGRPPITDPELKAHNKKKAQLKAAHNYRQKQKLKSTKIEDKFVEYKCENITKKLNVIHLYNKCKHLLKNSDVFKQELNQSQVKRLARIEKLLNSMHI